jgi:hypothetical protein
MERTFGFSADPLLSSHENARIAIGNMTCQHFFTRPSNMTSHDLCRTLHPPLNWKSLLGLGLNFIPTTPHSSTNLDKVEARFRDDLYKRCEFAGEDNEAYDPAMYARSNRKLRYTKIPPALTQRINNFFKELRTLYKKRKKKQRSNLLPHQQHCFNTLKQSEKLLVWKTDKNLGPCISERRRYVTLCKRDHFRDTDTYKQLTQQEAEQKMDSTQKFYKKWRRKFNDQLSKQEKTFLNRTTTLKKENGEYRFPVFYGTAKVHKNKLATRPIVSCSGSYLEGLGKWCDRKLQPIGRATKAYLSSSRDLLEKLRRIPDLPPTAKLFICDARSMYTSIDTDHALENLKGTIPRHVLTALIIIMKHNVFQWSDTFWHQKNGTAMGTPPACMWATIYFAAHEDAITDEFATHLLHFWRYIDDGLGIWNWTGTSACIAAWNQFKNRMNEFGVLIWDVEEPTNSVNYLDVTLQIRNRRVDSRLFEKSMNLYLYLPPHSNHPPGVLKGMIIGMIKRINTLTTDAGRRRHDIQRFFNRLVARGFLAERLKPVFDAILLHLHNQQRNSIGPSPQSTDSTATTAAFLHLQYHPLDPPSREIQRLFREHLLFEGSVNPYRPALPDLRNTDGAPLGINRLIVAYHRAPNLGNLLSPRNFDKTPGPRVSEYTHTRR